MTHYDRHYIEGTPEELDAQAIADTAEWFGSDAERKMKILREAAEGCRTAEDVAGLNFAFGFAGVSGRPFFAFCRKYCLPAFILWIESDLGGEPVPHDEKGFF